MRTYEILQKPHLELLMALFLSVKYITYGVVTKDKFCILADSLAKVV